MGCYGSEVFIVRLISGVLEVPEGIGPGLHPQLAFAHGVLHVAYGDFEGDDTACDAYT